MSSTEIYHQLSDCEILRLDIDDEHYYYGGPLGGEKQYYLSLTRVLDIGAPFPEGLRQYLRASTYEETQERLQMTGDRGSKLHAALDALMHNQELSLTKDYRTSYEKDAITTFIRMMRFLQPTKFETELVVADPKLRIAGTLDFRGIVDDWRITALLDPIKYLELDSEGDLQLKQKWLDQPERKPRSCIIIDWKFTGRNTYSHKVQVAAYKTMNNKTRKGTPASRAFTWRYSPRHKFGFDFSESTCNYRSFKRIYDTTIEYLGSFPEPPTLKRYPDIVRLYEPTKE